MEHQSESVVCLKANRSCSGNQRFEPKSWPLNLRAWALPTVPYRFLGGRHHSMSHHRASAELLMGTKCALNEKLLMHMSWLSDLPAGHRVCIPTRLLVVKIGIFARYFVGAGFK